MNMHKISAAKPSATIDSIGRRGLN